MLAIVNILLNFCMQLNYFECSAERVCVVSLWNKIF